MSIIISHVCDWCSRGIPDDGMSKQWLVIRGPPRDFDFCSVQCVDKWDKAGRPNPDFKVIKETNEKGA